jgi:hypothetical protein
MGQVRKKDHTGRCRINELGRVCLSLLQKFLFLSREPMIDRLDFGRLLLTQLLRKMVVSSLHLLLE